MKTLTITFALLITLAGAAFAGPGCGGCCGGKSGTAKEAKVAAKDPVCKMTMDKSKTPPGGKSTYKGVTYLFCNKDCKAKFDKEPAKYVSKK